MSIDTDPAPPARPSRRALRLGAAFVAAGALGAGIVVGIDQARDGSGHGTATTTSALPSQPATQRTEVVRTLDPTQVYRQAAPGVVEITDTVGGGLGGEAQGEGSGFVLDESGHIVTNAHVVSGAGSISVRFADGTVAKGTLLGSDTSTDVAVVDVDVPADKLEPLPLGTSRAVEPGQPVLAIGSPFGLEGTITSGIVSAVGRTIDAPDRTPISGVIQTDAAINKGNSGGPLLDASGRVIGVNSQIESDSGGSDGVGFAVPIETVRAVAEQLISSGKAEHGFLGVQIQTVTPSAAAALGLPRGAQVVSVEPGTPAEKAGLHAGSGQGSSVNAGLTKDGDVVVSIGRTRTTSADTLRALLGTHKPGDRVTLGIVRNGKRRTVTVMLAARPS